MIGTGTGTVKIYDEYDNLVTQATTEDEAQHLIDRLMDHDESRTYYYETGRQIELTVGPKTGFVLTAAMIGVWFVVMWAYYGFPGLR